MMPRMEKSYLDLVGTPERLQYFVLHEGVHQCVERSGFYVQEFLPKLRPSLLVRELETFEREDPDVEREQADSGSAQE